VSSVTNMDNMFKNATVFNQDLSGWCVTKIESEPTDFAADSPLSSAFFPNWGTCIATTNEEDQIIPTSFVLQQNYPNPFNPSTNIQFEVPETALVTLTVFNSLGQQVEVLVSGIRRAGVHQVSFDASDLASGIYFYRLTTPKKVFTEKMLLVK